MSSTKTVTKPTYGTGKTVPMNLPPEKFQLYVKSLDCWFPQLNDNVLGHIISFMHIKDIFYVILYSASRNYFRLTDLDCRLTIYEVKEKCQITANMFANGMDQRAHYTETMHFLSKSNC